jgi:hypothetical protein
LPISNQNLAFDTVEAEVQEVARDVRRSHKAPLGEEGGVFTASDIEDAQENAAIATAAAAAAAASAAAAAVFDPSNYYTKAGALKAAPADTDILGIFDGAFKTFTLANLISSIFKTARKIANAYFLSSFRLWDATDNTKGLGFVLSAIATATTRLITAPDRDVDLSMVPSAMAFFTGAGSAVLTRGFNISSVSRTSAGIYVITFTTAPPANYGVSFSSTTGQIFEISRTSTSITIGTTDSSGAAQDGARVTVTVF